jgi:hypothetical protein
VHLRRRQMYDRRAFGEALVRLHTCVLPSVWITAELWCAIRLDAFTAHRSAALNAGRLHPMLQGRGRMPAQLPPSLPVRALRDAAGLDGQVHFNHKSVRSELTKVKVARSRRVATGPAIFPSPGSVSGCAAHASLSAVEPVTRRARPASGWAPARKDHRPDPYD